MHKNYSIAAILTCHNRCNKTIASLQNLVAAVEKYNIDNRRINVEIFLTDDGCTDKTVSEVMNKISSKLPVHIITGNGNRYWAGGMRDAWNEALKYNWDYYLLLNDDTLIKDIAFSELFNTNEYCLKHYNTQGIYSGITSSIDDENIITYGGDIWINKFFCTTMRLIPSDTPQICDMTNANILLVPHIIVSKIGIFNAHYIHGMADFDYSMKARKHNIPVLITAKVCGICDNDHPDTDIINKVCLMTLRERIFFFNTPLHSKSDYLYFVKSFMPLRYPIVYLGRKLIVYFPKIYRFLYKIRMKHIYT